MYIIILLLTISVPLLNASIQIPLMSRATHYNSLDQLSKHVNQISNRHNAFTNYISISSLGDAFTDSMLIGEVSVGEPGQSLSMLFDLSAPSNWVVSSNCDKANPGCFSHKRFNCSMSQTCTQDLKHKPFNSSLPLGGLVYGTNAFDSICILSNNTYCRHMNFGLGVQFTDYSMASALYDGVFSMTPQLILGIDDMNKTCFQQNEFAFYITPQNSELTLCGYDTTQLSKHKQMWTCNAIPANDSNEWQFMITTIGVGDKAKINSKDLLAIYDSNSKFIILNKDLAKQINDAIGAVLTNDGIWIFPDCLVKDVTVTFEPIVIPPNNNTPAFQFKQSRYTIDNGNNTTEKLCASIFASSETMGDTMIVGLPWMEKIYTIFDPANDVNSGSGGHVGPSKLHFIDLDEKNPKTEN